MAVCVNLLVFTKAIGAGDASSSAHQLSYAGDKLYEEKRFEEAVETWRKALAVAPEQEQIETRLRLVRLLIELQRPDEACSEAEAFFFPPRESRKTLLQFNSDFPPRQSWLAMPIGKSNLDLIGFFRIARSLGWLDSLRNRAEAEVAKDPRDYRMRTLLVLLRVEQRDAAILKDLDDYLKESPEDPETRRIRFYTLPLIAQELSKWEAARPLALRAWEVAKFTRRDESDFPDVNRGSERDARWQMIALALDLGDKEKARALLLELPSVFKAEAAESRKDHHSFFGEHWVLNTACLMLDLDMTEEAFGLTEFLRTTVYSRTGATERCIETLKREIALIKGEKFPLSALPWLVAAGGTKDSEVFWEIGAEMDDDGTIYCFGRDFPSLNRRFDVEVSGGADNSRLSHLSLVPNAPTRGRWQGKLPFSTGFLQLALRENSSPVPLLAPVTLLPVHNAPNLIRDDSFRSSILQFIDQSRPDRTGPMEEVIDGDVELRDAGPCPGRPTLRVSLTSGPHLIAGDLVRIEPGKSYFQSAWLRVKNFDNSSDWAEIGREYVDKDGAVLATTWMKSASQEQRWSLLGQYLLTRAATVPASDVIPEGTIFIRPVMEVKGTFEVGLLYLGETLD